MFGTKLQMLNIGSCFGLASLAWTSVTALSVSSVAAKCGINVMRNIEGLFREIEMVPDFSGHTITSVNYRNGYGDTPLHIVCNWGDCEAIEILVAEGADVNAIGEAGFTPLHCAAEQNKPLAISKLLALGAIPGKNDHGQTPLELAQILSNKEAISAFNKNI